MIGQIDRSNPMRSIPASEAKAIFSDLLSVVERGEVIVVTRHGKSIARIVPTHAESADARRKAAVAWILENKRSGRRTGITIDDILSARDEGRP
jgi:prevent-host-death family protein